VDCPWVSGGASRTKGDNVSIVTFFDPFSHPTHLLDRFTFVFVRSL
jgi:hypothetical protein